MPPIVVLALGGVCRGDYQRNCDKQHAISGRLSSIDAISYAEIGAPVVAMRGVRLKGAKVHEGDLGGYARAAAERARQEDFSKTCPA